MNGPGPGVVAIAGDWHGQTRHASATIRAAADAGAEEILQLGDFGFWPDPAGRKFLRVVSRVAVAAGVRVRFLRGNHEHQRRLAQLTARHVEQHDLPGAWAEDVLLAENVTHLPDGRRWTWWGRRWAIAGGAVSMDRPQLKPNVDWFVNEQLDPGTAMLMRGHGPADVLLTHDLPGGVPYSYRPAPSWWELADISRAEAHRDRLQTLVDALRPRWIWHGHMHDAYAKTVRMQHGPVDVMGLDCCRHPGHDDPGPSWVVLEPATMHWRVPD